MNSGKSISMINKSVRVSLKIIILLLCLFQVVAACSLPRQTMSPTDLHHAYSRAIKDAEVAEDDEISGNLVAIVPANDALRWNRDMDEFLVVTWTSWSGYDDHVGSSMDDLFRPTPDPEVSDHEAGLDFPVSHRFVTVSETYRQWFRDLKQRSYGVNGYPWTRLGYTYDWGNPKSEIGMSEFVIRAGATVRIHAVSTTVDYCHEGD